MTTYGEVSWSDDNAGEKRSEKNRDAWLRLDEGSNEIRLVTEPFQMLVHRYKKDKSDKFGQKVACSQIHGSCPLCSNPDPETSKVRRRWLLGVISRKTQTYKILDISWAVFSQIKTLNGNKHWGHPSKYDIDITVDKHAISPNDYYKVNPIAKEPLSAADQVLKDNADLDDLKKRCTPPPADIVQKRLDKINGVDSGGSTGTPKKAASTPAPAAVSLEDDEELANSFPNYEEKAS